MARESGERRALGRREIDGVEVDVLGRKANFNRDEGTSSAVVTLAMPAEFPTRRFVLTFDTAGALVGFAVESDDGAKDLTTRDLRRIRLEVLQVAARDSLAASADRARSASAHHGREEGGIALEGLATGLARMAVKDPVPGRRGRGDAYYAAWAVLYSNACRRSTKPVDELSGRFNLSTKTIRNILAEARRRELLTRGPAGRAGGTSTPRALELLNDEEG